MTQHCFHFLHLYVCPFLCLPLSTQGNHLVTAYFKVPTQPLCLSTSHALFSHFSFAPHLSLFHFSFFSIFCPYLSAILCSLFFLTCCLCLSIFLHLLLFPLFLTCPPPPLLSLPLSAQSSAAQLAWFSSGVVKYKYNKDVFELVNPF